MSTRQFRAPRRLLRPESRAPPAARPPASISPRGGARSRIPSSTRWSSARSLAVPPSPSRSTDCRRRAPTRRGSLARCCRSPRRPPAPAAAPATISPAAARRKRRFRVNTTGLKEVNVVGGFDAAWELDIFGKYRREIEAARYDEQAALAARNAVLVSVVADVARSYVDLRGLQVRAAVLDSAIATLTESLRIATIRYQRGITNELDVTLATRELAVLEAQAAPVRAQVHAAQYTIATLLGLYPEDLVKELRAPGMVPSVPGRVDTGLPLELLQRRPDVQEAERELAGATARIGVATAELFPSIAVTGSIGFQRQDAPGVPILGQHIWSAGPAAAWPLLDFGQLDAQVEIADLQTRALLVSYKQTIQAAVRDVDTDLELYSAEQLSLSKLGTALVASQRAVTLANERYERGLTDYLNVVDAEREEYDIEEQFADAQAAAADQFIALYRSLGGGWENYQSLPPIHRPEPAIIAMFQRTLSRSDPLK